MNATLSDQRFDELVVAFLDEEVARADLLSAADVMLARVSQAVARPAKESQNRRLLMAVAVLGVVGTIALGLVVLSGNRGPVKEAVVPPSVAATGAVLPSFSPSQESLAPTTAPTPGSTAVTFGSHPGIAPPKCPDTTEGAVPIGPLPAADPAPIGHSDDGIIAALRDEQIDFLAPTDGAILATVFLRSNGTIFADLRWSPDGHLLAFGVSPGIRLPIDPEDPAPCSDLYLVKADATSLQDLTMLPSGSYALLASWDGGEQTFDWSPDSRWLVFEQGGSTSGVRARVFDLETGDVHQLQGRPEDLDAGDLDWSPRGDAIAYTTHSHVLTLEAGAAEATRAVDRGSDARWSPDGSTLAWISVAGRPFMDVLQVGRPEEMPVTLFGGAGEGPRTFAGPPIWSLDGSSVLIDVDGPPYHGIWNVPIDGSTPSELVQSQDPQPAPRLLGWSPSGAEILYLAGRDLRAMAADGSTSRLIALGITTAAWQPLPSVLGR